MRSKVRSTVEFTRGRGRVQMGSAVRRQACVAGSWAVGGRWLRQRAVPCSVSRGIDARLQCERPRSGRHAPVRLFGMIRKVWQPGGVIHAVTRRSGRTLPREVDADCELLLIGRDSRSPAPAAAGPPRPSTRCRSRGRIATRGGIRPSRRSTPARSGSPTSGGSPDTGRWHSRHRRAE
jgi:hypothetical protein